MTRLKETVFTTQRKNPRQERAYYWGVYVNAASYNFKIGKEGKQGNAYGRHQRGIYRSALRLPQQLHRPGAGRFRRTALHLIRCLYARCGKRLLPAHSGEMQKRAHRAVPSDNGFTRGFRLRFMSAGSKYKESVYRRVQIRDFARQALNEKINKMRERIDSIDNAVRKQGFSRPTACLPKKS